MFFLLLDNSAILSDVVDIDDSFFLIDVLFIL